MLSVSYHLPQDTSKQIMQYKCVSNYLEFAKLKKSLQLATAVTMFGLKFRGSKYFPPIKLDVIKNIASGAINPDNYIENQFIDLIEKSENLYEKKKKKSWWP